MVHTYSFNRLLNDLQSYHRMSQFSEVCNNRADGPNYVSNMQQAFKRNSEYFLYSIYTCVCVNMWVHTENSVEKETYINVPM